ncbi:unnamed protein product [Cunninghamella echinulata]
MQSLSYFKKYFRIHVKCTCAIATVPNPLNGCLCEVIQICNCVARHLRDTNINKEEPISMILTPLLSISSPMSGINNIDGLAITNNNNNNNNNNGQQKSEFIQNEKSHCHSTISTPISTTLSPLLSISSPISMMNNNNNNNNNNILDALLLNDLTTVATATSPSFSTIDFPYLNDPLNSYPDHFDSFLSLSPNIPVTLTNSFLTNNIPDHHPSLLIQLY